MSCLNASEMTKYDFREYGLIDVDYEIEGTAVTDTFTFNQGADDITYRSSKYPSEVMSSLQALKKVRQLEMQYHADISVGFF